MTYKRRRKRRPSAPVRKTDRRWRVPPPLVHGPEPLEGGTILEELREPISVVLWQAARDISLWTATPEEERDELFSGDALEKRRRAISGLGARAAVTGPLLEISGILEGDADEGRLAKGCEAIAKWAEAESLPGVALAFGQAIALIRDDDPKVAYDVGVRARNRGEDARAETWFRRAVMLSRQNGDWTAYSQSFLALGDLYMDRGGFGVAKKFLVRASRAAKRHSLHAIEEEALAGLAAVEKEIGASADGQESSPKVSRRRSARARE